MNRFISNHAVDGFEHAFDESLEIWSAFGVFSQPAFVFINAEGMAQVVPGSLGADGIADRIEAIL